MSSLSETVLPERPRTAAILVAAFLGFLGGQIMAMILEIVVVYITHFHGGLDQLSRALSPPWWSNAVGLVGLWTGFAAAIYYAYAYGGLGNLASQWRPRPSDVAYVVLGVACQLLVDALYWPFHLRHLDRPVTHLFGGARGTTFVLLVVMTTVLAPIIEEWLFRGVIYRAFSEGGARPQSPRSVAFAVIVSAGLFALAHGEPLQFVGLALLGVVLAWLVHRTQRLVPSIVTHISFNAVAVIALIVQRSGH